MKLIAEYCFTIATYVIDHFYVQQLSTEVLQNLKIKHRYEAIDPYPLESSGMIEHDHRLTILIFNTPD